MHRRGNEQQNSFDQHGRGVPLIYFAAKTKPLSKPDGLGLVQFVGAGGLPLC